MRWPWRRRDRGGDQEAIEQAQRRLEAADAAEPHVSRMVRELRRIQLDNQYSARLLAAFRDQPR